MMFMCAWITKNWSKKVHGWLFFYSTMTLINNAGYLAQMLSRTESEAILSDQMRYLGSVWIPFSIFEFVLHLCGAKIRKTMLNLLAVFHAAVYFAVLFLRQNTFYYASFSFVEGGLFPHIAHTNGILHHLYSIVILSEIGVGLYFLIKTILSEKSKRRRQQLNFVIAAILVDSIFYAAELLHAIPSYDMTSLGYTLATIFFYIAVFRFDILDTRALAKDFMIDEVSEGIIAVNRDGEVSFFNKSAEKIFPNLSSDGKSVIAQIKGLLKNGAVLQKDGRTFSLTEDELLAKAVSAGCAYMLIDDTEYFNYIKELQEQKKIADKANKAKSEFLSNMSHEIRSPINAVLGLDEMILRESGEDAIRAYAQDIQSSGKMLLSVINDILDFSKIESGKMEIIPCDYDLSLVISDLVNMTASKAAAKSLRFTVDVARDMPHCLTGDDTRIKQCVLNILTNAVKYTPAGSVTLTVRAEKDGENSVYLIFCVEDTGIGIKQEDIKKLFSPFERIEEGRNRAIEGTGLGMSIVKSLLAAMGSKLDVESEYGKGSRFSFRVKQAVRSWEEIGDYQKTKAAAQKNASYTESFQAPSARILVVDDTPVNLTVMRGLLKQTRVQIDTAADGVEGLEKARKVKYDVIFIDHRMPKMDGMQMIASLRADRKSANQKSVCVALTANVGDDIRGEYTAAGFEDYLSKPVEPKLLESMLSRYLPSEKVLHKGDAGFVENGHTELVSVSSDKIPVSAADEFFSARFGVDLSSALKNCGNGDVFLDAVQGFFDAIDEKAKAIEDFAAAQDWQNYTVQVHALKSSARLIGALDLSDAAKALEAAGDAMKTRGLSPLPEDFIREKTAELLKDYRSYKEKLSPLCKAQSTPQSELPPMSESEVRDMLSALGEFAAAFDFDSADSIMAELAAHSLPADFAPLCEKLSAAVYAADSAAVRELLKEFQ